ncbi:MAG: SRPBCC domain-containing protein [Phycisphaerae bacterium]|nr:SRPBCC domain-containing protein [Phycisphaerae bacterium]
MCQSSRMEMEDGQFSIEQEVRIAAPREAAWRGLLDVGAWWCHHFAKAGPRMVLEPFPGGRFYEDSADGTRALFGTVTFIRAPEVIRLAGPLGMSTLPVVSVYEWALAEDGPGASVLRLSHHARGLIRTDWREAHDRGWQTLWVRLRALVERGERYVHVPMPGTNA